MEVRDAWGGCGKLGSAPPARFGHFIVGAAAVPGEADLWGVFGDQTKRPCQSVDREKDWGSQRSIGTDSDAVTHAYRWGMHHASDGNIARAVASLL